ncbi:unnamed protein product [Brassica oleracea var. botrytis]
METCKIDRILIIERILRCDRSNPHHPSPVHNPETQSIKRINLCLPLTVCRHAIREERREGILEKTIQKKVMPLMRRKVTEEGDEIDAEDGIVGEEQTVVLRRTRRQDSLKTENTKEERKK